MTPLLSICWKEYREQRTFWLAVVLLASLLVPVLMVLGAADPQGGLLRSTPPVLVLVLTVAYAVVCGAMLLANEREGRTEWYLDVLSASRDRVWRAKVATGLALTLSLVLVMFLLNCVVDLREHYGFPWHFASNLDWLLFLLLLALEGYSWSLCAAAKSRSVLAAAGLSVPLIFLSWLTAVLMSLRLPALLPVWRLALAGVGLLLSHRLYCEPDRRRRSVLRTSSTMSRPVAWRVLLWLTWRQGRAPILVIGFGALVLGGFLPSYGVLLWPVATWVIGLACGTEVFAADQAGEYQRFLGNQRFSPLRLWLFRVAFWLAIVLAAGLILLGVGQISITVGDYVAASGFRHPGGILSIILGGETGLRQTAGLLLLWIWAAYGFAIGMLAAQLLRKQILALFAAATLSAGFLLAWAPSLVAGGLVWWQLLLMPALLAAASALAMRPWLTGRLHSRRPLAIVGLCCALAISWLGFSLWYRVAEIPDIPEPFDVRAFEASLPVDAPAGPAIRAALIEMRDAEKAAVIKLLKENPKALSWPAGKDRLENQVGYATREIEEDLDNWLRDKNLRYEGVVGPWLKDVFSGGWEPKLAKAVRLPLGLVNDPRQSRWNKRTELNNEMSAVGLLLNGHVRQLLEQHEPEKSLDMLLTVLALARQLRHKAARDPYYWAMTMEKQAVALTDRWLITVKGQGKDLHLLLEALLRQDETFPTAKEAIEAESNNEQASAEDTQSWLSRTTDGQVIFGLRLAPWEKERAERIRKIILASALHLAEQPPWQLPVVLKSDPMHYIKADGLDLPGSPGRLLSVAQWKELYATGQIHWRFGTLRLMEERADEIHELRLMQIRTALSLYQAEHKKAAASLGDLVPQYLPAVPIDPKTGAIFTQEAL